MLSGTFLFHETSTNHNLRLQIHRNGFTHTCRGPPPSVQKMFQLRRRLALIHAGCWIPLVLFQSQSSPKWSLVPRRGSFFCVVFYHHLLNVHSSTRGSVEFGWGWEPCAFGGAELISGSSWVVQERKGSELFNSSGQWICYIQSRAFQSIHYLRWYFFSYIDISTYFGVNFL